MNENERILFVEEADGGAVYAGAYDHLDAPGRLGQLVRWAEEGLVGWEAWLVRGLGQPLERLTPKMERGEFDEHRWAQATARLIDAAGRAVAETSWMVDGRS